MDALTVAYDPALVALSVLTAMVAAYCCFRLADPMRGAHRKPLLAGAAVAMGGGIWSMHFIGMLAASLPVQVSYDGLLTLISVLVSILMTGVALFVASAGTLPALAVGGLLMGGGITTMHYIGMAALRGAMQVDYDLAAVALSVAVAILASGIALWFAFTLRGRRRRVLAAAVMGAAIAGMHYTAMAAAAFHGGEMTMAVTAPALGPPLLAILIAIATFLIFGATLLIALPEPACIGPPHVEPATAAGLGEPVEGDDTPLIKLPVVDNKVTLFLDLDEVVSIRADSHYTTVHTQHRGYFCALPLSRLEARLDPSRFVRVHRSHIINIRFARSMRRQNDQAVVFLDGLFDHPVPVSRGQVPKLRARLGF
jgi:diguanylate cyclase